MALVKETKNSSQVIDQKTYLSDGKYDSTAVTQVNALVPLSYNAIVRTSPAADEDQFDYYQDGTGGTLVATILVTYTDGTKEELVSVERTFLLEA